ncbi:GNAT family N-acetyltransferase [Streptomyces sp. NPDC050560]|uniref:GNAT family N-acetyltransferase n=1 Tax=Streptomyces sp. NPDC050560 TaxID=3365630 RepID=UPI0037B8690D
MGTEIRELKQSDWAVWFATLERAFGGVPEPPEEHALRNALTELDRSLGIWDGADCVGTSVVNSFRVTVPGAAAVPAGGLTMVSVAATHRRRGLLTGMIRRQLADMRSRGEPLAVLYASEPAIYGRFGFGLATREISLSIDTHRVRPAVPEGTDGVRLQYAAPADVLDECEALYARLAAERPGMLVRMPGWERLPLLDPPAARQGASPLQCVLAEREGEPLGYVRFRHRPESDEKGPKGALEVRDLDAVEPAAYAALWRFLFDVDLTSWVRARSRPVDDAVLHLVSDVRRCSPRLRDALYLRLVDVAGALRTRAYRAPVDVVLAVDDPFCPWNEGRLRLSGDTGGAVCEPTRDPADLALSARDLGSAYLGGLSLTELAAAGRVVELRPGALARASLAFGSDVAPWAAHDF